jgi:hypothetical protein
LLPLPKGAKEKRPLSRRLFQLTAIGILPMPALIRASHSLGPVSCTDTPFESTATVTGMSRTSNS